MAINVNDVYKEVLSYIKDENLEKTDESFSGTASSKVGRKSYLTPQEFNLFAERAQIDIFENTLHDFKQAVLSGDSENALLIKERLSPFIIEGSDINKSTGEVGNSPYWIIKVYDVGNGVYYEEVDIDYFNKVKAFSSTAAGSKVYFPDTGTPKYHIYYRKDTNNVIFHPTPTANPDADIVIFPTAPKWTFTHSYGKIVYNSSDSDHANFGIHKSERGTLVNKILELAGISLRDQMLADLSLRNESTNAEDKIQ